MATAYEVDQWKDRCRMLTALLDKSRSEKEALTRRIRDNSEEAKTARAIADGLEWEVEDLKAENLQLRQRVDKLIRILNNDYDLCIQWDGLRKFWYVGLTDEGVRKRDERDAENAKLRACLGDGCADCAAGMGRYADSLCDPIKAENAKLRELVAHLMYVKPAQVTAITHDGKLVIFDEKLAEVGMKYEAES